MFGKPGSKIFRRKSARAIRCDADVFIRNRIQPGKNTGVILVPQDTNQENMLFTRKINLEILRYGLCTLRIMSSVQNKGRIIQEQLKTGRPGYSSKSLLQRRDGDFPATPAEN